MNTIPRAAINLVGFAVMEPNNVPQPFQPTWFNVWEAWLHKKAGKATGAPNWLFKRFATDDEDLPRKANYRTWLNGLNQVCHSVLETAEAKKILRQRHSKNALIYFDAWGETSLFEEVNSWRDSLSIDMLPKSIARDFGVKDFTCKLRGERNGFLAGLRVAQDCLNSGIADNVILCGQYRNFPVLALSEAANLGGNVRHSLSNTHSSVERVACLLLNKTSERGTKLHLSRRLTLSSRNSEAISVLAAGWQSCLPPQGGMIFSCAPPSPRLSEVNQRAAEQLGMPHVALQHTYGDSGCLNPVLAFHHWQQHAPAHDYALISSLDAQRDAWLLACWRDGIAL